MKTYTCIVCGNKVDDGGDNFCSKCRSKPFNIRLQAIIKAENQRVALYRHNRYKDKIINDVPGTYYEKWREL